MKNLNEPHKRDENVQEAEVVPFQRRSSAGEPLIPKQQIDQLRTRWNSIQTNFVDQPRKAVEDADSLVAGALKQIQESFVVQRANLEKKWRHGDDVSTEDLRVALQHYRAFFDRLVSMTGGAGE
jgi:hypothetical protein